MQYLAEYGEEAYKMQQNGYTYQAIAERFGVSKQAVYSAVKNYCRWANMDYAFKTVRNPNLKKWVKENCGTLDEFADMLQISKGTLYKYFREETKTLYIPLKIQEITGLPLDDIIVRETIRKKRG